MKKSLAAAALFSCSVLATATLAAEVADTILTNARVYTMNPDQPEAEAVAVKGNRIIFVGPAAAAGAHKGEGTTTIDLAGRTILPGFVSAHDHPIASTWTSRGVELFDAKTTEEALQLIKAYAEANPDRPVFILDYTIHDGWLNTAALEAASNGTKTFLNPGVITPNLKDTHGGIEDKIGSLEIGKYADIVVLERDPFKVDPMMIEEIDVTMTMMDGKFTYLRDADGEPTSTSIDVFLSPAEMTAAAGY